MKLYVISYTSGDYEYKSLKEVERTAQDCEDRTIKSIYYISPDRERELSPRMIAAVQKYYDRLVAIAQDYRDECEAQDRRYGTYEQQNRTRGI